MFLNLKRYSNRVRFINYLVIPPVIGIIITLISYPSGFNSLETIGYILFYSYSIGIPSCALFFFIEKKLNRKYPWLLNPLKRLLLSLLLEVFLIFLLVVFVNLFFVIFYAEGLNSFSNRLSDAIWWVVGITITGIIVTNAYFFFKNWRQSAVNEEKLKREKLAAEYQGLKSQVNPHFLFNSLTALTNLVYEDQDKAANYIREIADVYRYILEKDDQEVVLLSEEIRLIKSLVNLHHYRHGNNLQVSINLIPSDEQYIVTMSLQMLLENALKHNIISDNMPLAVVITMENNYIVIVNNLQEKDVVKDSNSIGLTNIKNRYAHLTDQKVIVEKNNEYFRVKIPILYKT